VISGIVVDQHALVTVMFRTRDGGDVPIEFVIDTGFTDEICLPPETVAALGLRFQYAIEVSLADASEVSLPVHDATIVWNREEHRVRVLATGIRPLMGTALLEDYEVVMQFVEGGVVTIDKLHQGFRFL
jgi:clan AA aspartic protease